MSETKPPPSANQNGPGSPTADGRTWYSDPTVKPLGGYYIDPDPDQAAKDAAAREDQAASTADMVPGKWSESHLIAVALSSSPPLQGPPQVAGNKALCTATGETTAEVSLPPKAAACMADVMGEKMVGAVTQMRNGATINEAFQGQMKGQGGNVSNPNFTRDELAQSAAYPEEWGAPNK